MYVIKKNPINAFIATHQSMTGCAAETCYGKIKSKLTFVTTYTTFSVLPEGHCKRSWLFLSHLIFLLWALMRGVKTGRLLYVPLSPISRRMMLAPLKLKPEVDTSELIVERERRYSRTTYWSGDVEYAKHLPDRGALKISCTTSPE